MKKALSVLAILAIISAGVPAMASPYRPAGGRHSGMMPPPPQHHEVVRAGYHHMNHRPAPPPPVPVCNRSHGGLVVGGVLARRSYWRYPYCDYRLGWYDDYCIPPRYSDGVYINFGVPIRF